MPALIDPSLGYAAGLTTSVLWAGTTMFFSAAGKRLGPLAVNTYRILLAIVLLGVTHRVLSGVWIPEALPRQVLLLALSGFIGLSIGDQALFTAFVDIGPRLSALIMTTAPIFAALFGWAALGETLTPQACAGILITIAGVGWVVLDRRRPLAATQHPYFLRGVLLAFLAAACQAGGLLLSKQGIGHGWLPEEQHMSPQTATLIRMLFAGIGMAPIVLVHHLRRRGAAAAGVRPRRVGTVRGGILFATCGAVCGPFLGVWLSLVAADNAPVGIAQTLMSLTPIFVLPLVVIFLKERITPRAIIGAVVAVAGCVLLFFEPLS